MSDMESDRVERTISTTDTDKFCEAVCAFANDISGKRLPGYLLIGVDNHGQPAGLTVTDRLLQNLGGIRSDGNVLPQPMLTVEKFTFPNGDVAVIEVLPSDLPPVRYKGRIWIRIGPRKAVASEQDERMLSERRISYSRTFDTSPCREATLDDISLRLFSDYRMQAVDPNVILENNRSIEEQLASLRFYDLKNNCPTIAGLLLFGKNPRFFLPGAYVQFLKISGTSLTEYPIDQMEISGDLRSVLNILHDKFIAYNQLHMRRNQNFSETVFPEYPEWALRELLHNAVMHRDYQSNTPGRFYWFSDRIEIQNPGGLYGEVTPETITKRNSYRNPVIAESMKAMGYVNRFGYGIQRAKSELKKNNNPDLKFEFDGPNSVAVFVYPRSQ